MCLLTYIPEHIQPDIDALRRGAYANPDGHGFAIVIPEGRGRILVRKSMVASSLLKEFAVLRELYPVGPAIFHSRITTDGVTDLFNCHPFMANGDKRTVIGHNGILPTSVRPGKTDVRSDTRIFAEEVAGHFRLNTLIGRSLAGEWMGSYNKMAILTVDPNYDSYGYIINEDSGMWSEGIWYSNGSFRGFGQRSADTWYGGGSYRKDSDGTWRKWEWCGAEKCPATWPSVSPYNLLCTSCKACGICDRKPCECALLENVQGKDPSYRSESGGPGGTVVIGSPAKGATVAGQTPPGDYATTAGEYWEAMEAAHLLSSGSSRDGYDYDLDPEDDPADHRRPSQLEEVLALADHLNNGGEIEDLTPTQQELLLKRAMALADRERAIVEGPESVADASTAVEGTSVTSGGLIKRGDVTGDQEGLMFLTGTATLPSRGLFDID
jgi:hypothetical protein